MGFGFYRGLRMESLREEFIRANSSVSSPDLLRSDFLNQQLSEVARNLKSSLKEFVDVIATLNKDEDHHFKPQKLGDDPVRALFFGHCVSTELGAIVRFSAEEIKKSEGYKKLHAAAADPAVDMAVEVVQRYHLSHQDVSSFDIVHNLNESVIVLMLDKPYNASSEALPHLAAKKKSPRLK